MAELSQARHTIVHAERHTTVHQAQSEVAKGRRDLTASAEERGRLLQRAEAAGTQNGLDRGDGCGRQEARARKLGKAVGGSRSLLRCAA